MNTFQYWFDYIKRNGKYYFAWTHFYHFWKMQVVYGHREYNYVAFRADNSDGIVVPTIEVISSNWQHPYENSSRYFVEQNFDLKNSVLKPLISLRRII